MHQQHWLTLKAVESGALSSWQHAEWNYLIHRIIYSCSRTEGAGRGGSGRLRQTRERTASKEGRFSENKHCAAPRGWDWKINSPWKELPKLPALEIIIWGGCAVRLQPTWKMGMIHKSLRPNLSDNEMTQFKLDPQTSNLFFFVKATPQKPRSRLPSVPRRPGFQNKTWLVHKQEKPSRKFSVKYETQTVTKKKPKQS